LIHVARRAGLLVQLIQAGHQVGHAARRVVLGRDRLVRVVEKQLVGQVGCWWRVDWVCDNAWRGY